MDAFSQTPPDWTEAATHAFGFICPCCGASSREAERVWLNRRSPVYGSDSRRKYQEFYHCKCGSAWWAWSTDRPTPPGARADTPYPDSPHSEL
ncbi:MAG: hypothetical protein ACFB9N_00890 [Geitlerinemataceae cyanobacterium]